jgi:hypothetical protein
MGGWRGLIGVVDDLLRAINVFSVPSKEDRCFCTPELDKPPERDDISYPIS